MIKLKSILHELKEKTPLINLFKTKDILDNGKLKNLLIHYIDSQHNLSNEDFIELVTGLMKLKSKYPDLLMPKKGYAYRGTSITPEMYKQIKSNDVEIKSGYTIIKAPYESSSKAQSWSYDFKVAQRFADKGMFNNPRLERGGKPAIIRVKINDEFVGNPKLTSEISNMVSVKNEKEIFHLGKNIPEAEWFIATADLQKLNGSK